MNKRSALMVAAGLILTLVVGGLAVAIGLTGPSVSSAVPRARRAAVEPMVRTVRRTVTDAQAGRPDQGHGRPAGRVHPPGRIFCLERRRLGRRARGPRGRRPRTTTIAGTTTIVGMTTITAAARRARG